MIESRSEKVGALVASVLGMAWSAVTYFVVPAIVVEGVGPIQAAKRSFEVLKQTWGEALSARFGIGFFVFIAFMVAMIPCILGVVLLAAGHGALGVAAIVIGVVSVLTVSLVSTALQAITIGALYLYASEGTVPKQFDDELFRTAFAPKQ